MERVVIEPIVQYGFLGFCGVLLGVVIWLIKILLGVLKDNQSIVAANTDSNKALIDMVRDLLLLSRSVHDKLISRPCIAKFIQDNK
jgi:hypothetical protein